MSEGHVFRVGDKFSARDQWEDNRFEFRYSNGSLFLQYNVKEATDADLDAFANGEINFGLFKCNATLFFVFKITGFCDWSDQSFSIRLLSEEDAGVLNPKGGHYPVTFIMVDSETGVIKKLRVATMSKHLSSVCFRELESQSKSNFSLGGHNNDIDDVYKAYSSSRDLAAMCFVMERLGNK